MGSNGIWALLQVPFRRGTHVAGSKSKNSGEEGTPSPFDSSSSHTDVLPSNAAAPFISPIGTSLDEKKNTNYDDNSENSRNDSGVASSMRGSSIDLRGSYFFARGSYEIDRSIQSHSSGRTRVFSSTPLLESTNTNSFPELDLRPFPVTPENHRNSNKNNQNDNSNSNDNVTGSGEAEIETGDGNANNDDNSGYGDDAEVPLSKKDPGMDFVFPLSSRVSMALGLLMILLFTVCDIASGYYIVVYMSRFVGTMLDGDSAGFYRALCYSCMLIVAASASRALTSFAAEMTATVWRASLVGELHAMYLGTPREAFYALQRDGRIDESLAAAREGQSSTTDTGNGDDNGSSKGDGLKKFTESASREKDEDVIDSSSSRVLDNPDQRIAKDTADFATTFVTLCAQVATAPMTIALYTWRTWSEVGWMAPVAIYVYFGIGWAITRVIMAPIVTLVFRHEKLEGDFRFAHLRVRGNAESISFYGGGLREMQRLGVAFSKVIHNSVRIAMKHLTLNTYAHLSAYAGGVLVYVFIAIAIFNGGAYQGMTPANMSIHISRSVSFCISLMAGFTAIIDSASLFSDWSGYAKRISEMMSVLRQCNYGDRGANTNANFSVKSNDNNGNDDDGDGNPVVLRRGPHIVRDLSSNVDGVDRSRYETFSDSNAVGSSDDGGFGDIAVAETIEGSDHVSFKNVTVLTPDGRVVIARDLSFTLRHGEGGLLISGPSGCGKSSILRALSGLWPDSFTGTICRPLTKGSHAGVMFLSQRPYLVHGSLREQLAYPGAPLDYTDNGATRISYAAKDLETVLAKVGLTRLVDLAGGWDVPFAWDLVLSPGEQQRLALARLLHHAPRLRFAILDESTSAVDAVMEQVIYKELVSCGVSLITVTHRDTLRGFHAKTLLWKAPSTWEVVPTKL